MKVKGENNIQANFLYISSNSFDIDQILFWEDSQLLRANNNSDVSTSYDKIIIVIYLFTIYSHRYLFISPLSIHIHDTEVHPSFQESYIGCLVLIKNKGENGLTHRIPKSWARFYTEWFYLTKWRRRRRRRWRKKKGTKMNKRTKKNWVLEKKMNKKKMWDVIDNFCKVVSFCTNWFSSIQEFLQSHQKRERALDFGPGRQSSYTTAHMKWNL